MIRNDKNSANNSKVLIVTIILAVLLTSGHVYSVVWGDVCYFVIAILIIFLFVKTVFFSNVNLKCKNIGSILLIISIMTLINLISDLYRGVSLLYSIKFTVVLVFALLVTLVIDFTEFRKYFVYAIVLVSSIAIMGYFYGIFVEFYYPIATISNINGVSYYNGIIFLALDSYSRGRNIGIFWEPGIFAICITIATLFHIYDNKKLNFRFLGILLLALITTLSTTGYVFFAFILLSLAILYTKKGIMRIILISISIALLIVFLQMNGGVFEFLLKSFPRVFTKFITQEGSVIDRTESILVNMDNFFHYPITGVGITEANVLYASKTNSSQTSSMTLYFIQYGITGVVFVVFQLRAILLNKEWRKIYNLIFCICWIIVQNVEITTFFSLIYIISFYFIQNQNNSSLLRRENEKEGLS